MFEQDQMAVKQNKLKSLIRVPALVALFGIGNYLTTMNALVYAGIGVALSLLSGGALLHQFMWSLAGIILRLSGQSKNSW